MQPANQPFGATIHPDMAELTTNDQIHQLLRSTRVVAVLGANPSTDRPAYYVPDYLASRGLRILPVNPVHTNRTLWGEKVRATLAELAEPVDIVDVFRRAEALPDHLADVLAMTPPPRAVWLQSGIRNDDFAARLGAAGIDIVQDRCAMVEYRTVRQDSPTRPAPR